ncbi:MAG: hypothetical protein FWC65_05825 [Treponema sp.]|nr:hypothetical protein [Treponema sp.]
MGRNFVKCIASSDGNTYCYDASRDMWAIVEEKDVAVSRLPDDVVRIITADAYRKMAEAKDSAG